MDPKNSFALLENFFHNKGMDMLEIAGLSNTVIMTAIWKRSPDLAIGLAYSKELRHIRGTAHVLEH